MILMKCKCACMTHISLGGHIPSESEYMYLSSNLS